MTEIHKTIDQLISEVACHGVIEAIGDGVSIQDSDFRILYQNKISRDLFGAHIGKYCYDAYALRDKVCEGCPLYLVFKDGVIHKTERHKDVNGSMKYFEVTASPLRNPSGGIIAGIEIVRDITKRRLYEKALLVSEERFKMLADHSPNMIFINKNGRINYVNKKCEEVMGYTSAEFMSDAFNFMDLVSPEYRVLVQENFRLHMSGKDIPQYDYKIITKSGKEIDAIISTKLIDHHNGKAILGVITDITDQKKLEEELKRRVKELEEFYNIAVGREVRMKGLKDEIKKLKSEIEQYEKRLSHE
ncbi:MAG: PAS domain S-box protein [Nitrospirae bacterium]|nr:PAS domain S-box protein [Nitrospirota bacterium]